MAVSAKRTKHTQILDFTGLRVYLCSSLHDNCCICCYNFFIFQLSSSLSPTLSSWSCLCPYFYFTSLLLSKILQSSMISRLRRRKEELGREYASFVLKWLLSPVSAAQVSLGVYSSLDSTGWSTAYIRLCSFNLVHQAKSLWLQFFVCLSYGPVHEYMSNYQLLRSWSGQMRTKLFQSSVTLWVLIPPPPSELGHLCENQ